MHVEQATTLLVTALAVRHGCAERQAIDAAMISISRLMAVLESQRMVCAAALRHLSPTPQTELATVSGIDRRDAASTLDRAEVAGRVPAFRDALADGAVSAGHVDRLGGALRRLDPQRRNRLLEHAEELVAVAERTSPEEFATHLRGVERELHADGGETRLARQKADVRLRTWVGQDNGMHYWQLTMDPETALRATGRLRAAAEAVFHGGAMPAEAPIELRERESFLRAHALIGLITGQGRAAGVGRPEYIIVEDRRHADGHHIDLGIDTELPLSVVAGLRAGARQVTVELDGAGVVAAPGALNLGRSARVASPAQRRVLRALYATCAVPGCAVRVGECTAHHVVWWRHGGRTDLDNLLPVCWRHHHDLHEGGWAAVLHPGRRLVITLPSGAVLEALANRAGRGAGP